MCDELYFIRKHGKVVPHVKTFYEFNVSEETAEGCLYFDGYYYVNDGRTVTEYEPQHTLPLELVMIYEKNIYHICVYDRILVKDTSVTSKICDSDDEEMEVCFYPTAEQKIHFKILKVYGKDDIVPPGLID